MTRKTRFRCLPPLLMALAGDSRAGAFGAASDAERKAKLASRSIPCASLS